jgi:hypothetical protein
LTNFTGTALKSFSTGTQVQKGIFLLMVFFFLLLLANVAVVQADTSYLQSLEDEASSLSLDKKTASSQNGASGQSPHLFNNDLNGKGGGLIGLTPGLTAKQFEQVLKNNYIGSYLFYKRLSDSKKAKVYSFYQSNPDPNQLREKLIKVSTQ